MSNSAPEVQSNHGFYRPSFKPLTPSAFRRPSLARTQKPESVLLRLFVLLVVVSQVTAP